MAAAIIEEIDIENLPNDVDSLKVIILDISRRLKNALHMVESQKVVASNAMRNCDTYRNRLRDMSVALSLETAKCDVFTRRKIKEEEFARYDKDQQKAQDMQNELRLALIDHSISNTKKTPIKIIKMKESIEKLENRKTSQKILLKNIDIQEKLIEELANSAQIGDVNLCRNLIRQGANVNEIDTTGYLPIHYACSGGSVAVAKLLLDFGSDATSYLSGVAPIAIAARNGHNDIVRLLLSAGVSPEETGDAGTPPVVCAAMNCNITCVESLLTGGGNINAVDIDGNTALHVAAMHVGPSNPSDMIRLLMIRGANTKITNKKGNTPIQEALALLNNPAMEALGGRVSVTANTNNLNSSLDDEVINTLYE
jgi:ankyrin repeat protein